MTWETKPAFRVLARAALFMVQGGLCPLCGQALRASPMSLMGTFEHVWPRKRKLKLDTVGNLLLTHQKCNAAKADRDPYGCEIIWLYAVNRRLGLPGSETRRWDDVQISPAIPGRKS